MGVDHQCQQKRPAEEWDQQVDRQPGGQRATNEYRVPRGQAMAPVTPIGNKRFDRWMGHQRSGWRQQVWPLRTARFGSSEERRVGKECGIKFSFTMVP